MEMESETSYKVTTHQEAIHTWESDKKKERESKHKGNCVNNTLSLLQQHLKYPCVCCFYTAKQGGSLTTQSVLQLWQCTQ